MEDIAPDKSRRVDLSDHPNEAFTNEAFAFIEIRCDLNEVIPNEKPNILFLKAGLHSQSVMQHFTNLGRLSLKFGLIAGKIEI